MKHILLIISFVLTLYIIVYMYQRLDKSLTGSIRLFVPYLIIFILFCVNLVARQKGVLNNLFYNICCCLVFAVLCYCGYRAIFDKNMIMNERMGYNINFNYYSDVISPMKIMLYGLSVANICFMFRIKPKSEEVAKENSEKEEKTNKKIRNK